MSSPQGSPQGLFHNLLQSQLHALLMDTLAPMNGELSSKEFYGYWSVAPQKEMGHLAFPCFPLAQVLKSNPAQIAQKLATQIPKSDLVRKIHPIGPYLNFFLNMEVVAPFLLGQIHRGDFFLGPFKKNLPKTMIEYFQPNTHKEVHVGHLRNLCLGQAMVELHRYLGFNTIASTYPGDSGTHVAKVLWYLKKENLPPPTHNQGEWLGLLYTQANESLGQEQKPEKQEQNRRELAAILKSIGEQSGDSFELWKKTRQWSLEHIQKICHWAQVKFDHWYFESEVDAPSLDFAQKLYREGKLIKDSGAIGMDLKDENLGFCLLVKQDGNGLYSTKDLELARQKFDDYGIQKSIYVVDKRQSFHFKQVFKILEKIAYPQAQNCYHLEYEFVELPDGAISSRKGNIISAQTLIEEMQKVINEKFLTRHSNWGSEEKARVAHQVAQGAIKYGMTCVDNNKKIVFNMQDWLQLDGESGPYIQYTYARIQSLIAKVGLHPISQCRWSELRHPLEESLIVHLSLFNNIVEKSCDHYKTSLLTSYLYDLAKEFNSFYTQCPLMKAKTEDLKMIRCHLAHKTGLILAQGLKLLGIPAPHKM